MLIRRLIVHCSATLPNAEVSVKDIRRWHTEDNGWADIGYHGVIPRDGTLEQGRPITQQGAHVLGHNADSLGVCLIGGHGAAATDEFSQHFTNAQQRTLISICAIAQSLGLTIHGHNEFAAKGCPGFNVKYFIQEHMP